MKLKCLTYTSFARLDIESGDLDAVRRIARDLNALDGITGLLVFNGTHFLQIIEGAETAIDDLVVRLRRDPRHGGIEIRDEHWIEERSFPGWEMELVRVNANFFEARETLADRLPPTLPEAVRTRILRMTELISGTVEIPD